MPGATNATLTLLDMIAGRYTVTVRNATGTVASVSAIVGMFGMTFTNGAARLTVTAPSGSYFRIERSDTMGIGSWQSLTNFTVMESMSLMSDIPP